MYLDHFKLKLKPFQISTDPRFLWLGENHKEAFAVLKYGILDNRGFLLLTGDVGTGKTTLIHALVNSLGDEVVTATVPDPNLDRIDFFNYIAKGFGFKEKFASKGEFISKFRTFLCDVYEQNKKSLLIIDESQLLNNDLLEEIRLLSNIEKQNTKLLNIFFVGQNEFNDLLWEDRNRALRQRITVNYNVYTLSEHETGEYIRHRLKVAGTTKKIFTNSAVHEIAIISEGFPRTINIICDHALLTGFVKGVDKIDDRIIRECAKDIQIPRSDVNKEEDALPVNGIVSVLDSNSIPLSQDAPSKRSVFYKFAAGYAVLFIIALYILGYFFNAPVIHGLHANVSDLWFQVKSNVMDVKKIDRSEKNDQEEIPVHVGVLKDMDDEQQNETLSSGEQPSVGINHDEDTADIKSGNIDNKEKEQGALLSNKTEMRSISQPMPLVSEKTPDTISPDDRMSKDDKSIIALLKGKVIINFSHNSNEVSDDAVKILGKIAALLIRHPELKVGVIGYTDSSGIYSYNKSLSRFRANIVKSYLTGKGAMPEQVAAIGMGPQNPIEPNSTWQGRKSNRRVEIVLYEDIAE